MSQNNFLKNPYEYFGPGTILYNKTHSVEVHYNSSLSEAKTVYISIISVDNAIEIKIRELNNYLFNYVTILDSLTFDKMKSEQSLEINFEEIRTQIVELLKDTLSKETFIKLEVDCGKCKLIFYGRSKIKCIIFLVIELKLTDPKEIINEMSKSIANLKSKHDVLSREINSLRREIVTKDTTIKDICVKRNLLEKEYYRQLDIIYSVALKEQSHVKKKLNNEIEHLVKRLSKMLSQIEVINKKTDLKHEADSKLLESMQNMRLENEKHCSIVNNLKVEIIQLNSDKEKLEKKYLDLQQLFDENNRKNEEFKLKNDELQRDIVEATKIITQKTQINDEIAKDLVQANQMLVNFNFHYDKISKECDEFKEKIRSKELIIEQLQGELENLCKEFTSYKKTYSQEEISKLKRQLTKSNERIEELEKQNKEALMLNNVLTRKLSTTDFLENHNLNSYPNS